MKIERYPDRNWDELADRLATEAHNPEELIRAVLKACGWTYEVTADEWVLEIEWKTIGEAKRHCKALRISGDVLHYPVGRYLPRVKRLLHDINCDEEARLYEIAYCKAVNKIKDTGILRSLGWL